MLKDGGSDKHVVQPDKLLTLKQKSDEWKISTAVLRILPNFL